MTIHSYSQRWGEAKDDPGLAALEGRLRQTPAIAVPTIVLHGEEDGATLVTATEGQSERFSDTYERRTLPDVGHFVAREAPAEVAAAIVQLAHRSP